MSPGLRRNWVIQRVGLWVVAGLLCGRASAAPAQTFYKWTDDGGVVHFSDVPPPQGQGVEERRLTPPAKPQAVEAEPAGAAPQRQAAAEPRGEGPARVVIVSNSSPRVGPSAMHVQGSVKNVGGADAQHVAVTLSAVDAGQGNPCLREEAAVTPSTLHAGDTGTFDVDVDSPCLLGDTSIDVVPLWD